MASLEKISGLWGGRYWYPDSDEPVPFSAWLTVTDFTLFGTTLEPNTITFEGPEELTAELTGEVQLSHVTFQKTYPDVDQPPVYYDGVVSRDRNKISGEWYLNDDGFYSGEFEMTRLLANNFAENKIKVSLRNH